MEINWNNLNDVYHVAMIVIGIALTIIGALFVSYLYKYKKNK